MGSPPSSPNNWLRLAGPPPLTPEYRRIWEDIQADLKAGGPGNWPSTFCIPAGMPAMMSFYDPAEIIVTPDTTYILISHNDDSYRRIYTDGRAWPAEAVPTFAGYSIGKWIDEDGDGKFDVLEAETRYFSGPRAFDLSGIPLHEDNETVIKERIYLDKADKNLLHDEITVTDHALTRPWTVKKSYRRSAEARPEWPEYLCVERSATMRIGSETYLVNKDGYLMPAKKGQTPPSVQYFPTAER